MLESGFLERMNTLLANEEVRMYTRIVICSIVFNKKVVKSNTLCTYTIMYVWEKQLVLQ